ncbi:type I secretion outer membrane protein, TolC family (plasmid) [Zymomonas mobilis subsp. mobilis str. CP4 = NRRL B-14023]|uniref:RND efflux system, outer membrane lipoprotein, NodT family n=2 Tax=Zymomonas mobilis TaxID=542 RepID=A0A806CZY6_ZYMMO|nr:RND efflux system, outer membrane lipoprotein, NodT family [Zymomonas mobilis subsp. mobilis ZM4 = ATCC 31821]AHB11106.1 efflux transporter, outer membrane factor lipoprotein, NodT family [Zymomonas mobilis subsp. mobilis str. CP4 = NRRL B-14023]AHJ71374.1 type I secretion outer membrane protein, TolC family [Zymomonas mobilis subsp. mobilis NRRL B-12526]TWE24248.1 NodT family efflux transporter outer membrane factor (OMF) lipoprotein [Zymomonas mobilis]AHJ73226.1 type I secretion outer memb
MAAYHTTQTMLAESFRSLLFNNFFLLFAVVLSLEACTVGPDYKAPHSDLVQFHNSISVERRAGEPLPSLDHWWEEFHDLELVRIEQRVLMQNLDLKAAIGRIQQAHGAAEAAAAQMLPTLDFAPQVSAYRLSNEGLIGRMARNFPGYNRDQRAYDVHGAASWEIDLFGGLRRGHEAARDEAEAAIAQSAGVRVSVAGDAADAYFQIRGYQARLLVANERVATDSHLLDLVQQRRIRGVSSQREVDQAIALLQSARETIPVLRAALEVQLNRLDVLMGVQPGTYAHELALPSSVAIIPSIGNVTPADVLRRRPDVIAAERRLAASNARIGAALADYYPKLSLSGALGFQSLSVNKMFTPAGFQPASSGILRWRIFDFGKIDAEVHQAKGAYAEQLAQYRSTVLHAAEDVENAFMSLAQSEKRAEDLRTEVASLAEARDLSSQSYKAGIISLTDVLAADRQLLEAKDRQAENQSETARAAVRSFRAIGGGWEGSTN